MSDAATDFTGPPTEPAGRIGYPLVAWAVILVAVAFMVYRNATRGTAANKSFEQTTFEIQARYCVGAAKLLGLNGSTLYEQVKSLARDNVAQRLRLAVLAGELVGPSEALKVLHDLPEDSDADRETVAALEEIYRTYQDDPHGRPPDAAVQRTRETLGWFGELAAAPPDTPDAAARAAALAPARRTAVAIFTTAGLGLLALATGLFLLVISTVLAVNGTLRPRFRVGSHFGGVYAETFAVWFLLFFALNYAARFVSVPGSDLLVAGIVDLASLAALCWPVVRGVPWRVMLAEVGLARPARPGIELASGVGIYLMAVPLFAAGLLVTFVLMTLTKKTGMPGHPLTPEVAESGRWVRLQALLVAAVVAPIVEETMFRGVLYRHLRELFTGTSRLAAVLSSGFVVSFIFAVIHPPGWLGVPPLMGLAFAFCLAREWRGTLLPSMFAHAIHNAIVLTFVILVAG